MSAFIEMIKQGLLAVFKFEELVTIFISVLPIVEARGAIPIGIGYDLHWAASWFYAFLGSSMIIPVLLLVLLPFVKWLMSTKIFRRIGTVIYEKFEKGTKEIKTDKSIEGRVFEELTDEEKQKYKKNEFKKYLGLFIFVLIPAPLTGVWTGCAIAAIMKLKFWPSFLAILLGNFFASLMVLALCMLFEPYVDIITLIIGLLALIAVIGLILKIIFHKDKPKAEEETK